MICKNSLLMIQTLVFFLKLKQKKVFSVEKNHLQLYTFSDDSGYWNYRLCDDYSIDFVNPPSTAIQEENSY